MTLDELLQMYEGDAVIVDARLDTESINTPKLHHKYLTHLMRFRMKRVERETLVNEMRTLRFRYYRGELSRDVLIEKGWEQYQGLKPLKNEMEEILKGDVVLGKIKRELEYLNEMIYALEEILKQIKARDWNIKSAIDFKRYLAGN